MSLDSAFRAVRGSCDGNRGAFAALVPFVALAMVGCSSSGSAAPDSGVGALPVLASQVTPVTRVEDAKPGVFIPPFESCKDGVCTPVAISGCTKDGLYFPSQASCEVVVRQRPYWSAPPAKVPPTSDARLMDTAHLGELAWVKTQVEASGCTCCHDARVAPGGKPSQWDIAAGPLWMDTLSDTGLALFAGYADSSSLGAYPASKNNGFDRDATGIPTNDTKRMKAFLDGELARRGVTEAQARAVPPFGGPIYANRIATPGPCGPGQGVSSAGRISWTGGPARYVYVLSVPSDNPGVPPNLDLPAGTLFRLDVLASADPVQSGLMYGTTPPGSFQVAPATGLAPALQKGTQYHLHVSQDVGIPLTNCVFTMGEEPPASSPDAGASMTDGAPGPADGGAMAMCAAGSADAGTSAFGVSCTQSGADPACACPAPYCATQPGQSTGYCTATGCKENPAVCPTGWSCFDVSVFQPGAPSICRPPANP